MRVPKQFNKGVYYTEQRLLFQAYPISLKFDREISERYDPCKHTT